MFPRYFQIARVASLCSTLRCSVGAVIVAHKPISVGFNQQKTHPIYADGLRSYSIHAEISAILHARCDVRGGSIFVYREDRTGKIGLAKPCPTCSKALIEAGIKRVYYTIKTEPFWAKIDL